MKRILVLAMCLASIVANAQEKKGGFAFEAGAGTAHFGNYSPVSVFADPTDSYGLVASDHISLGYKKSSGLYMGLTLIYDGGNTSFQNLNETFFDVNALFDIRRSLKLNDRFELEAGVAVGLLVHSNAFDYAGDHYSFTRYGTSGHFSMGLNYNLKDGQYIGFRATFPSFGSFLDDKPALPTGLDATDKTQFSGYGLQVSYGIRF